MNQTKSLVDQRGSVLAFVAVVVALGAIVLIGLLRSAASQSLVNADRQAVMDVGRIMQGITQSVMSDALSKAGSSSSYSPSMPYSDSAWQLTNWTLLQAPSVQFMVEASTMDVGNGRDPGLPGTLVWDVPLSKAYPITGTVTLDLVADNSFSRTEGVAATAHKIPTGAIPLVCYSQALSSQLGINVDGPCFLAAGITPSTPLRVTGGHTFVGRSVGVISNPNSAWSLATGRQGPLATWAVSDAASLISTVYRSGPSLDVVISDPDTPPAPFSSAYTRNGQIVPALELANYGGTGVLVVEMTGAAAARGLAIVGAPSENGMPLTIVVVGNVTLVGTNSRAVTIVTTGMVSLSSGAPGFAIPSGGSARDTFWKGYLSCPVDNLSFSIDENWTGRSYSIMGGLAFKGGTLSASIGNGANTLSTLNLASPDDGSLANFQALFAPPCRYDSLALFQPR